MGDDVKPCEAGGGAREKCERCEGPLAYHEAGAVLGVEVDAGKLWQQTRRRLPVVAGGCDCCERQGLTRQEAWLHCPYCGTPLWEAVVRVIPQWDAGDPSRPTLAGLPVLMIYPPSSPGLERTAEGRRSLQSGCRVFVGEWLARTNLASPAGFVSLSCEEIAATKNRLKTVLEPLGLWDERKFGLWALLSRLG